MSKFVDSISCDMCSKIDVSLTELSIGSSKHHLCYDCVKELSLDLSSFIFINCCEDLKGVVPRIKITEKSNVPLNSDAYLNLIYRPAKIM